MVRATSVARDRREDQVAALRRPASASGEGLAVAQIGADEHDVRVLPPRGAQAGPRRIAVSSPMSRWLTLARWSSCTSSIGILEGDDVRGDSSR